MPVETKRELALRWLANSGRILVYPGTRENPDSACVVGNPLALADLFKDVLSTKNRWVRNGILKKSDLFNHIWKKVDIGGQAREFDVSEKEQLLAVIDRFEVLLPRIGSEQDLIVPSMLPDERPTVFGQYWPPVRQFGWFEVGRTFELTVALKGFFPKIIYRVYHLSAGERSVLIWKDMQREVSWRTGLLIRRQQSMAVLILVDHELQVQKISSHSAFCSIQGLC